jgi:hypothetical protein
MEMDCRIKSDNDKRRFCLQSWIGREGHEQKKSPQFVAGCGDPIIGVQAQNSLTYPQIDVTVRI